MNKIAKIIFLCLMCSLKFIRGENSKGSDNLFLLYDNPDAKCLDGSAPGYYYFEGKDSGKNKFYIYLQGGA